MSAERQLQQEIEHPDDVDDHSVDDGDETSTVIHTDFAGADSQKPTAYLKRFLADRQIGTTTCMKNSSGVEDHKKWVAFAVYAVPPPPKMLRSYVIGRLAQEWRNSEGQYVLPNEAALQELCRAILSAAQPR